MLYVYNIWNNTRENGMYQWYQDKWDDDDMIEIMIIYNKAICIITDVWRKGDEVCVKFNER